MATIEEIDELSIEVINGVSTESEESTTRRQSPSNSSSPRASAEVAGPVVVAPVAAAPVAVSQVEEDVEEEDEDDDEVRLLFFKYFQLLTSSSVLFNRILMNRWLNG